MRDQLVVYTVLFKLLQHSRRRKCPSETRLPHAHHMQRSTVTLWVILSFPFSQIYTSTLGLQIECQFYSYMISLGPRHCQTCHHLGSQMAFGVCLNQSSKTTSGKSSSRLGSPKSRLLNSPLCTQIMAGHATDLKVEIGMMTC